MKKLFFCILLCLLEITATAQETNHAVIARQKYQQGIKAFNNQKYSEAITLFEECDKHSRLTHNVGGATYTSLTRNTDEWIAAALYRCGNEEEAKKLNFNYRLQPVNIGLVFGADENFCHGVMEYKSGRYSKALEYLQKSFVGYKNILGYNHQYTAFVLLIVGEIYYKQHYYKESLRVNEDSYNIFISIDDKHEHLKRLKSGIEHCKNQILKEQGFDLLYDNGIKEYNKNNYLIALKLFSQCDSLNKTTKRQMPYYSCNTDEWIASCHYKLGQKTTANQINDYFCKFTPINRKNCPKSNELLSKTSFNRPQDLAKDETTSLLNVVASELGKDNYFYANLLATIAYYKFHKFSYYWRAFDGDFDDESASNLESDFLEPAKYYWEEAKKVWHIIDENYSNQVRIDGKTYDMSEETQYNVAYLKNKQNATAKQAQENQYSKEKKMDLDADLEYEQGIKDYYSGNIHSAIENFILCIDNNGEQPRGTNKVIIRYPRNGFYKSSNASSWLSYCLYKTGAIEETIYTIPPLDQTTKDGLIAGELVYKATQTHVNSTEKKNAIKKALKSLKNIQPKCAEYALLLQQLAEYFESSKNISEYLNVMSEYFNLVIIENDTQTNTLSYFISTIAGNVDANTFVTTLDPIFMNYDNSSLVYRKCGKVYVKALKNYYSLDKKATNRISELEHNISIVKSEKEVTNTKEEDDAISQRLYSKALILSEHKLREMKSYFGEISKEYIKQLCKISEILNVVGENERFLQYCDSIIVLRSKCKIIPEREFGRDYERKALAHFNLGEYEESLRSDSIALTYLDLLGDKMRVMTHMAEIFFNQTNYNESERLNNIVIKLYIDNMTQVVTDFLPMKNYLLRTRLLIQQNKYDEAIVSIQNVLKQYSLLDQRNDFTVIQANELCAFSSYLKGDLYTFLQTEKEVINNEAEYLKTNFGFLTTQQRNYFWSMFKPSFEKINNYCLENQDNAELLKIGYNAILISKSILLSSDKNFSLIINQSGDKNLIENYQKLLKLNNEIEKEQDEYKKKELYENRRVLEQFLLVNSKEYGNFTRNFTIKWDDVSRTLNDKDIAVEFFTCKNDNNISYGAFILRKGWKAPKCVEIGSKSELDILTKGESLVYNSQKLSEKIWGEIIKIGNIKPSDNIYFATDGLLLKLGIEYLPAGDGFIMSEKYQMYRLSSTRELCLNDHIESTQNAYLFGGARFDAGHETLAIDGVENSEELKKVLNNNSNVNKGGVAYLPGTKIEVDSIYQILISNNYNAVIATENNFTESTFKHLSGKNIGILHIATHGFYFTNQVARKKKYKFLQRGDTEEQTAMTRSGLILSGANHILSGNQIPYIFEDGILTSKEIGQLDLSRTQLAVLSACQTGLGDISEDGVFGLQRGFKKAGVSSIVMSLWEVNDEATQILMLKFYNNLISGMSKHQALVEAQNFLRTTENKKFSDPKYWAAFIILDAIENNKN